jgi:hypothetical protein
VAVDVTIFFGAIKDLRSALATASNDVLLYAERVMDQFQMQAHGTNQDQDAVHLIKLVLTRLDPKKSGEAVRLLGKQAASHGGITRKIKPVYMHALETLPDKAIADLLARISAIVGQESLDTGTRRLASNWLKVRHPRKPDVQRDAHRHVRRRPGGHLDA